MHVRRLCERRRARNLASKPATLQGRREGARSKQRRVEQAISLACESACPIARVPAITRAKCKGVREGPCTYAVCAEGAGPAYELLVG